MVGSHRTLTSVTGLAVGHAGDPEAATGCTVILGPFRAAVDVRGLATGSRELDALSPLHLVDRADAVLLTGGSAYGLAAADGVMAWLEERGRGFHTGRAVVPIVPSAVIYDLGVGSASVRPDPAMGRAAAEAATGEPVRQGRVGVGTGATVGKLRGPDGAESGGVGSWAVDRGDHRVGAVVVINAFGDVLDGRGAILAGCRAEDGSYLDTARALREGRAIPGGPPGQNTTLAVVATDHPLGQRDLQVIARQAMNGVARRISPAGSALDGDLVFALSTGGVGDPGGSHGAGEEREPEPPRVGTSTLMGLGEVAREVLERAMGEAVTAARGEG